MCFVASMTVVFYCLVPGHKGVDGRGADSACVLGVGCQGGSNKPYCLGQANKVLEREKAWVCQSMVYSYHRTQTTVHYFIK